MTATFPVKFETQSQPIKVKIEQQKEIYPKFLTESSYYNIGHADGFEWGHADGYNSGYDIGYDSGHDEGFRAGTEEGYRDGLSAGKEEGYQLGHNVGNAEGYEYGFGIGKDEEVLNFWRKTLIINGIPRSNYINAFGGQGWRDDTYKPRLPILVGRKKDSGEIINGSADSMFEQSRITNLGDWLSEISEDYDQDYEGKGGLLFDTKYCSSFKKAFAYSRIKHIEVDLSSLKTADNAQYMFAQQFKDQRLESLILTVSENTKFYSNSFLNCGKLEFIEIRGELNSSLDLRDCTGLQLSSIQYIVSALKELESTSGLTLTLNSKFESMMEDEELSKVVADKKWILAYGEATNK